MKPLIWSSGTAAAILLILAHGSRHAGQPPHGLRRRGIPVPVYLAHGQTFGAVAVIWGKLIPQACPAKPRLISPLGWYLIFAAVAIGAGLAWLL